jgi:haloalkane dehalogenase
MPIIPVLDSYIAYSDSGAGAPAVVFLHGNPTSSHLWRNVVPHVADLARTLAPDLIGMGESGKPDIAYRFADHARYLDAWFEAVGLADVVLVGHDWGGALAQDWAARHPGRTRAIVLQETFLRPMTWADYSPPVDGMFRAIRTPGTGEQMVLDENWFIEVGLRGPNPGITDEDLAVYRSPYPDPASRLPLLQWGREHPVDGEPAEVYDRVVAYGKWMADTPQVPKLLLTIEPNGMVTADIEQWARENSAALEVESIGPAGHHAPEDQPDAIGQAIAGWLQRHRLTEPRGVIAS